MAKKETTKVPYEPAAIVPDGAREYLHRAEARAKQRVCEVAAHERVVRELPDAARRVKRLVALEQAVNGLLRAHATSEGTTEWDRVTVREAVRALVDAFGVKVET